MSYYTRCVRCLLCLSLVCILLSIGLLMTIGNMSNQVEISTGKKLLLHTKEDLMNRNIESTNITTNHTDLLNGTDYRSDFNIVTKGQWQQSVIGKFCSNLNHQNSKYTPIKEQELFRHLAYDDNYGIIYCIVPKAGCTKMKLLFVLLQGVYTLDDLLTGKVTHTSHLHRVKTLADLTPSEREERLKYYYKFMIVRNPLERLISAYRNKITRHKQKSYFKLKQDIIKEFRNNDDTNHLLPSFSEFVKYFITHRSLLDDHFQSAFNLCQPCMINYDFYAHFTRLNNDMDNLLQTLGIPKTLYFNDIKIGPSLMPRNKSRTKVTSFYYNQISNELKRKLNNELRIDSKMYQSLFSHKN